MSSGIAYVHLIVPARLQQIRERPSGFSFGFFSITSQLLSDAMYMSEPASSRFLLARTFLNLDQFVSLSLFATAPTIYTLPRPLSHLADNVLAYRTPLAHSPSPRCSRTAVPTLIANVRAIATQIHIMVPLYPFSLPSVHPSSVRASSYGQHDIGRQHQRSRPLERCPTSYCLIRAPPLFKDIRSIYFRILRDLSSSSSNVYYSQTTFMDPYDSG